MYRPMVVVLIVAAVALTSEVARAQSTEDGLVNKVEARMQYPFTPVQRQKFIQELQDAQKDLTKAEDEFVKAVTGFLPLPNYEVRNAVTAKAKSPGEKVPDLFATLEEKLKRPLTDSEAAKVRDARRAMRETTESVLENLARDWAGISGISADDCRQIIAENGI